MEGFYRIYKGDTLVCEQKNSITEVGRSIILKSILGLIPSVGGSIVVGVSGEANPAVTEGTQLIPLRNMKFAIAQAPVTLTSLDPDTNHDALIFKATINDKTKYSIYEVGLFPSGPNNNEIAPNGMLLYSGAASDGWQKTNGTPAYLDTVTTSGESRIITSNPTGAEFRIGSEGVFVKSGDTIESTIINANLSSFGDKDVFKMAVDPVAVSGSSIQIKFTDSAGNYFTKTFTVTNSGYHIESCTKDAFTTSNGANWADIVKTTITSTSCAFVLDGIKFDDDDNIDANYGLVSRAALSSPIEKNAGEPITIEYYLSLAFNRELA